MRKAENGVPRWVGWILGRLQNRSMLQKITLAFLPALLLPAFAIGSYTYSQMTRFTENEIVRNTRGILAQISDNMQTKMLFASRIGETLAYNSNILGFLGSEFVLGPDTLTYYLESINPLVSYAMEFEQKNIDSIFVYTTNESITETRFFLSHDRIGNQPWYKDLETDFRKDVWLYHNQFDPFSRNPHQIQGKPVFTLIRGIYAIGGRFLGVITVDISADKMLSSLDQYARVSGQIFALDNRQHILYPPHALEGEPELTLFRQTLSGSEGDFREGDDLYVHQEVEELGIRIIGKIPLQGLIRESLRTSRNVILMISLGVLVFGGLIYLLIRSIFSKLRQMVNVMNTVSEGNFDVRIPVTRKDELGQLARDFNILIEKINDQVRDILQRETAQKNAQLLALQYQINPHFMYNMVDTFNMKMELAGNYETADAIARFGKMLRYNISSSLYASLREEVRHVENYLGIQRLRYGDRIRMRVRLPEELARLHVIKFLLQPIVENSIKHGFTDQTSDLLVDLDFAVENGLLVIAVSDNGRGVEDAMLSRLNRDLCQPDAGSRNREASEGRMETVAGKQEEATGSQDGDGGIGLLNISHRLKLYYGEEAGLQLHHTRNQGVCAVIRLPLSAGMGENHVQGSDRG